MLFFTTRVSAGPLSEQEFWQRLEQTNSYLLLAITQAGDAQQATFAKIQTLWQGIDSITLDRSTITIDMSWLTSDLSGSTVQARQQQVQALLDYHARPPVNGKQPDLDTLKDVLRDPRFHYPAATPEPIQPPSLGPSGDLAALSEMILAVLVAVVVAAVLIYLARGLRIQRAVLTPDSSDDDPTTSALALERATESQTAQDYRNAIRYLYLSSLLLLDERGVLHYDRTLTNREHLRQIANRPAVADALRPVVNTFDRVWYGFAPVDETLYTEFVENVERLRRLHHE